MRKSLWIMLAWCSLGLGGTVLVTCRTLSARPDEAGLAAAPALSQPGLSDRTVARVDCYGEPLPAHALARMGTARLWYGTGVGWDHSRALAFSPDGKTLAAQLATHISGMTVCLWDAATGKEMRRLTTKAVKGHIASLGFSPDGKTLVTVNYDQTVCRWEVATGKLLHKREYQGPKRDNVGRSLTIAFLPNGEMLGSGDFRKSAEEERGAYVWDVATGKEICQLSGPKKGNNNLSRVRAFSPDGMLLAIGVDEGKKGGSRTIIYLWDVATGKKIRKLAFQDRELDALAFSPDGKTLASEDRDKICVWEVVTGKKIHLFQKNAEEFSCDLLTYSPDGKTLVGGSEGHLWDLGTGKEIRSFGWKRSSVAIFSPDGKILAVGDYEGSVRLWEVATGKEVGPRKEYRVPISSITYSPDGKTLASLGEGEKTVRLWEVTTGKEIRPLAKHVSRRTEAIAYSPNGKMIVSMDYNALHLWDTATGKEIRRFERSRVGFQSRGGFHSQVTFSPDGKKLAACWEHKLVCVWEVATGKQIYALDTHQEEGTARQVAITFSPDGRLLATPGKDNTVYLREVATGKLIRQLGELKKPEVEWQGLRIFSLAFSPDGRLLAMSSTGELEGKVRVWEVASGKEIWQLAALKPGFRSGCVLAFSPDGRILATVSQYCRHDDNDFDPTVRLWEVASGKAIGQLAGHQGVIWTITFSPDGKTLASGSADLTCLVWDVTSLTNRLKSVPARPLPAQALSPERLEAAWADLAKDPTKAYAAIRTLQAAPAQAIALLQARVRPVTPLADPQQLKRWITDLSADDFAAREKAQREIEKLGEPALPALRQALEGQPMLEAGRRLKDLVAELEPKLVGCSSRCLRELRAVYVLESIGTKEAKQLLQALAKGIPGARLTVEAEIALARLAKQPSARP